MGFPLLLKCFHIVLFLSLYHAIAQHDRQERDALYALKASFKDPFLNDNWTGLQCSTELSHPWYGIQCVNGRVSEIVLEGRGLKGEINSDTLSSLTEVTILNLKNNSISGKVMNFSSNQKMKRIDLSGNKFRGAISRSLLSLNVLESLQLQGNNLTGRIPEFNQSSLTVFNVSNNNLRDKIPQTHTLQSFSYDSYADNPDLCGPPTSNICNFSTNAKQETNQNSSHSKKNSLPAVFLFFDVVGLVVVILLFIVYCKKSRKLKKMSNKDDVEEGEHDNDDDYIEDDLAEEKNVNGTEVQQSGVFVVEHTGKLIFEDDEEYFELNDLLRASAEGLGKGIFGTTYKAMMEGRPAVVVKRLRDLKPLSMEEFTKQLHIIGDQKHPNLLPLLAYYCSKDEKLLVFKHAEKGNLFNRIHEGRGKDRVPFRWSARLSVARGVARALEYLHLNPKLQSIVPHGNLKSTNVLLDDNDMVLVSDYGLTSLIAQPIAAQRMVSYKSPEYQTPKKVSKKSDIWSYGCLLLELLTGRVSAHSAPPGTNGVDLSSWVHRAVREEWTAEIFDVEISVQRSAAPEMLKLLQLAIRCCDKSPDKRPAMTEVVREVENIKIVQSEDEGDLSMDQSLTDESLSTSASAIMGDER